MVINENAKEAISKYIESQYNDPLAARHLSIFLSGFNAGFESAIGHAAEHVYNWHHEMSDLHDSTVKGILAEVEGGIRDLGFGDV